MQRALGLILSLVCWCPAATSAQGPLTPPGPPAPLMKTLDQIEPRAVIEQTDIPLTITNSGSYVLGENLRLTNGAAIVVAANHVTLDLNGFLLDGSLSADTGIEIHSGVQDVTVRGGTIRAFTESAVSASNGFDITCSDLTILDCQFGVLAGGTGGLAAGARGTVVDCRLSGISNTGISLSSNSVVRGCTVVSSGFGIGVNTGSRVERCVVSAANGIVATGPRCIIANNLCEGDPSIVGGSGILAIGAGCVIQNNVCDGNTLNGIGVSATDCRIVGNQVVNGADNGLFISSNKNYVAENIVRGNADNYDIAPGNQLILLLCEIPETIDWPAHVKLAGTLEMPDPSPFFIAIDVEASDVTIDLGGHALLGGASGFLGISGSGVTNLTVRNGTIRGWDAEGVNASNGSVFEDLRVLQTGRAAASLASYAALSAGRNSLIRSCLVEDSDEGIRVSSGSRVEACVVRVGGGVNGGDGIVSFGRSIVKDCIVSEFARHGIFVRDGSVVEDCLVEENGNHGVNLQNGSQVLRCTARLNGSAGIFLRDDPLNSATNDASRVVGNVCEGNGGEGIRLQGGDAFVAQNTCIRNGAAGIVAQEGGSRIEENQVRDNEGFGIHVQDAGNIIVKNTASGNATNYVISAGNGVGDILNASAGIGTSKPWVNFEL